MKFQSKYIMLSVLMLMGIGTKASATVYTVSTADEFMEHWKANDSIKLAADIDLTDFNNDFRCDNYTAELSGVSYDGKDYFYAIKNAKYMLASEMNGAYIHDIQFKDCNPTWSYLYFQESANGFSLLCRYSKNCKFEDVILDNIKVAGDDDGLQITEIQRENDAACLVCQDNGSTFKRVFASNCKAYVYNSWAGILCAEATGSTFEDCGTTFCCGVYSDGTVDNSYAGGFVGEATDATFTNCQNMASVTGAQDCVGGIAGKSTNTTFRQCSNFGAVNIGKYGSSAAFISSLESKKEDLSATISSDQFESYYNKVLSNGQSLSLSSQDITNFMYETMMSENTAAHAAYQNELNRVLANANKIANEQATEAIDYHWQGLNGDFDEIEFRDFWLHRGVHGVTTIGNRADYARAFNTHNYNEEYNRVFQREFDEVVKPEYSYTFYTYMAAAVAIVQAAIVIGQTVYDAQDSDDAGGICGLMNGGGAYECANYGFVYSADAYAGGIVGDAAGNAPVIENCLNQGLVKGYEQTGGIVGRIESGAVMACLNTGNVNTGNSSNETFGRIYGQKDSGALSEGNYYAASTLGDASNDCRGVTLQMLASGEAAQLLNKEAGSNVWRQTIGVDYYPSLRETSDSLLAENIQPNIDPTVRTKNAANFLQALACQSSDIVLTGDIDLNTSMFNFSSRYMPFTGSIDGQGHQLKNVKYTIPASNQSTGSNDNNSTNVGLLSFARNATFKNLTLNDFSVYSPNVRADTIALFVANSSHCTYDNIHIVGESSITASETTNTEINYPIYQVGGLVAYSDNDKFTNCYTGPMCKFESPRTSYTNETNEAGGLVAVAKGSSFEHCYNQASVTTSDDYVGGIVSHIIGGSITSCLNMGSITGEEQVGGIAGYATDANIKYCVNTGTITSYTGLTGNESEVGGIVGTFTQDNAKDNTLSECANWGAVVNAKNTDQCVYGETYGDPVIGTNYYSCIINGGGKWNVSVDYNSSSTGGGKWTEDYNYANQQDIFYQDIDNNTFPTKMPVPIAAAGKVYKNIHCDGSAYYSNRYSNTANHTATPNKFNMCAVCGVKLENTAPADISITNADEMVDFRYAVNKNQDFKNSTITLANDIDLKDVDFSPIGTYTNPCNLGTFDGNYHRIKNLYVETTDGFGGLFGCITGNTMMIENVIIDSTCVVRTNGIAVAGLVGCVDTPNGDQVTLTISHCGNEASVAGTTNVAGILGSVFTNDNMVLNIENCYNTGTIKGDKESAAICGYGRDHATVTHSWNSGSVTGCDEGYPFLRYNTAKTLTVVSCFDINGQKNNGVPTFNTADMKSGRLAFYLNSCKDGINSGNTYLTWCQKIGTDSHPAIKYASESKVYHHEFSYCDTPTVTDTIYNNSDDAVATLWHDYDEDGICTRKEGEVHGEPIEAVDNVWHVTKPGDLYYIAQEVNNGNTQYDIELMNDVTDNSYVQLAGYLSNYYKTFHVWTPIGTASHPYTKSFNGKYHTISGLYCDKGIDGGSSLDPVGLFGTVQDNKSIANVGVIDSYFRSYWKVGLLAGCVVNSSNSPKFKNIYTIGAVKGVTGLGGVIGYVQDKDFNSNSITKCWTLTPVIREKDPTTGYYDQVNNGAIVGTIRATTSLTPYSGKLLYCYYLKDITTFTTPFGEEKTEFNFRSGDICEELNRNQDMIWEQSLESQTTPTFGNGGVSYTRSVNGGSWGSLILPFPVTSNDSIQYYVYKDLDADHNLHLEKVASVRDNTPCFFKVADGCSTLKAIAPELSCITPKSSVFTMECNSTATTTLNLVGSYEDKTISPDDNYTNYYLASNKLWWGEKEFSLPAFRSYIQVTQTSGVKAINIFVDEDGETTKIGEISADGKINFYNAYNLNGQSVSPTTKGIIIRDGKKMLNK